MNGMNAISREFPLFAKYSRRNNFDENKPTSKLRQFPEMKHGNNYESPIFLKVPMAGFNQHSYNNPYMDPPNSRKGRDQPEEKKIIYRPDLVKDVKERLPKDYRVFNRISKSIDYTKQLNPSFDKEMYSISPRIEKFQSSYLANINEFDIKESSKIDASRVFSLDRKPLQGYDPIKDKSVTNTPDKIQSDKWGKFYENYIYLANNRDAGFLRKKDYFTDFIDKNKYLIDINKPKIKLKEKIDLERNSVICSRFVKRQLNSSSANNSMNSSLEKSYDASIMQHEKDIILEGAGIKLNHRGEKRVNSVSKVSSMKRAKEVIEKNNLMKIRMLFKEAKL